MAFLAQLQTARDQFFREHQPEQAACSLSSLLRETWTPEEKRAIYELLGLVLRAQKKFDEAGSIYEDIPDYYQAGYCALLAGNLPLVQQHWSRVLKERQNHWCITLYGMITRQARTYPTLFQIRNHLESDIANLWQAGKMEHLENLLAYIDYLTQFNLEAPKFAGRALMHAGQLDRAGIFLMQGQKALPNDPEIYFHLGQFGIMQEQFKEARLMLNQCLLISPTYSPAKELLESISQAV